MAVYLALFAVMWKYAPDDAAGEEGEDDDGADDCCSLLGGGGGGAVGGSHPAPSGSMDLSRPTQSSERPTENDPERGTGIMLPGSRNMSTDIRPTVGGLGLGAGSLYYNGGVGPGGYDINSRNSSFASVRSDRSARKNSIAEVGLRTAFG